MIFLLCLTFRMSRLFASLTNVLSNGAKKSKWENFNQFCQGHLCGHGMWSLYQNFYKKNKNWKAVFLINDNLRRYQPFVQKVCK